MTDTYEKWSLAASNNLVTEFKKAYNRVIKNHCKEKNLKRWVNVVLDDRNAEIIFEKRTEHIIDPEVINSCSLLKDTYIHYFRRGLVNFDSDLQMIFIYYNYIRPINNAVLRDDSLNVLVNCSNDINIDLRSEFKIAFIEHRLSIKN